MKLYAFEIHISNFILFNLNYYNTVRKNYSFEYIELNIELIYPLVLTLTTLTNSRNNSYFKATRLALMLE